MQVTKSQTSMLSAMIRSAARDGKSGSHIFETHTRPGKLTVQVFRHYGPASQPPSSVNRHTQQPASADTPSSPSVYSLSQARKSYLSCPTSPVLVRRVVWLELSATQLKSCSSACVRMGPNPWDRGSCMPTYSKHLYEPLEKKVPRRLGRVSLQTSRGVF